MSDDTTLNEFAESNAKHAKDDLARKTVCGIPPEDWGVSRLGEVTRVVSGKSLPKEYQDNTEEKYPIYKVSDMNTKGNEKYVSDSANQLSEKKMEDLNHTAHPAGTTILPKVGAALLTNKRRMLSQPSSFDNNVMGWVPEKLNQEFLYYVSCMIDMEAVAQKGAVPSISKSIAESLKLPSPPLPEQRKIATVLHTVDRLIEKTRSVVDQSQKVEEAVRRQILLGSHQEESTKSERLGPKRIMIPNGWGVRKIDEISDIKNGNRIVKGHDYSDSPTDYPFIRIKDMENGTVSMDNIRYLKEGTANQMDRGIIHSDEVYITVTGRVGDAGTIPEELDGARFTDNAAKLYNLNDIIPDYLSIYLRSKFGQDEVHRLTVGSTQPKLSMYLVEKMEVVIPPLEQQQDIVAKIRSVRSITESNKKVLEIATRIKQGLMQDLLSGEVRTTDKSIEVPDEISQHG